MTLQVIFCKRSSGRYMFSKNTSFTIKRFLSHRVKLHRSGEINNIDNGWTEDSLRKPFFNLFNFSTVYVEAK